MKRAPDVPHYWYHLGNSKYYLKLIWNAHYCLPIVMAINNSTLLVQHCVHSFISVHLQCQNLNAKWAAFSSWYFSNGILYIGLCWKKHYNANWLSLDNLLFLCLPAYFIHCYDSDTVFHCCNLIIHSKNWNVKLTCKRAEEWPLFLHVVFNISSSWIQHLYCWIKCWI